MTLSLNGMRAWFLMMNLLLLSSLNGTTNPVNFPGSPDTGNHTPFYVDLVTKNRVNTEKPKTQTETGSSQEYTSEEKKSKEYKSKDCPENEKLNKSKDWPENEKLIDSQLSAGVGPSNAVMCIACIALNGHVLLLYKSQLNRVVPTLYFINGVADILIGSGVALQSFIFIPQIGSNKEIAGYLSAVSYVIVGVSIRVSTFVNLVLCITRAINILYPFYHVPRAIPVRLTCLYSLIWLILAIWDIVWFHLGVGLTSGLYVIKTLLLKPEVGFAAISTMFKGSVSNVQSVLLLFVPPFLAPLAVLILSTTVQVFKIFCLVAYSG